MDSDANQAKPLIDREVLRRRIKTRLRTTATNEALDALTHSLNCVLSQHLDVAWNVLRDEVSDLVVKGEFEDIPVLEPRHFLPKYQQVSDTVQEGRTGCEPGPSVRSRR